MSLINFRNKSNQNTSISQQRTVVAVMELHDSVHETYTDVFKK